MIFIVERFKLRKEKKKETTNWSRKERLKMKTTITPFTYAPTSLENMTIISVQLRVGISLDESVILCYFCRLTDCLLCVNCGGWTVTSKNARMIATETISSPSRLKTPVRYYNTKYIVINGRLVLGFSFFCNCFHLRMRISALTWMLQSWELFK